MTVRNDLHIRQGETWSFIFTKRDGDGAAVDLTGYTARAAFRQFIGGALEAYLSNGGDAIGGSIALGGVDGTVTLSMTAAQSAALLTTLSVVSTELWRSRDSDPRGGLGGEVGACRTAPSTVRLRYDLELVSPAGVVTRELEGAAIVYREVTT